MKKNVLVVMCSFLLVFPGLSLAKEKTDKNPVVDAYEQANKDAQFESNRELSKDKTREEVRLERRAEKEAVKSAQIQNSKQLEAPLPLSTQEVVNENAKLKHDGEVYNKEANKEIRAEKRVEKGNEKTKKKTEEIQDKDAGQVNVKF